MPGNAHPDPTTGSYLIHYVYPAIHLISVHNRDDVMSTSYGYPVREPDNVGDGNVDKMLIVLPCRDVLDTQTPHRGGHVCKLDEASIKRSIREIPVARCGLASFRKVCQALYSSQEQLSRSLVPCIFFSDPRRTGNEFSDTARPSGCQWQKR